MRPDRPPGRRTGPEVTTPQARPNVEIRHDADASTVAQDTDTAAAHVTNLAAWRQRRAWAQAVLWLRDHGLPAAVPYDVGGWLRARGIEADWYHRNPCHQCPCCGTDGCYVLAADGPAPPPAIHCCTRMGAR